jgi:hypothetical protein
MTIFVHSFISFQKARKLSYSTYSTRIDAHFPCIQISRVERKSQFQRRILAEYVKHHRKRVRSTGVKEAWNLFLNVNRITNTKEDKPMHIQEKVGHIITPVHDLQRFVFCRHPLHLPTPLHPLLNALHHLS